MKRFICLFFCIVLFLGNIVMPANAVVADLAQMDADCEMAETGATSYPKISALKISRIYQSNQAKDLCYWCSVATVQGYCLGEYTYGGITSSYISGGKDYNFISQSDAVSKKLNTFSGYANNSSNLASYPIKMTLVSSGLKNDTATYQKIYNQLKAGKPVIVYATRPHASVVIGYNGSSTKLEPSGFTVLEIKKDGNYWTNSSSYYNEYANSPQSHNSYKSCYVTLDSWLNTCGTITQLCYPTNAIKYNIKYNANGGTGSIVNSTVNYGKDFTLAKSGFTRGGYTLSGYNVYRASDKRWYTSGGWATASEISSKGYTKKIYKLGSTWNLNNSWTNGAVANDTFTFYAVWEQNAYNINYNANGGTGTMSASTINPSATLTIPECKYTREGYYFAGYNCYRKSDNSWYTNTTTKWVTNTNIYKNGYIKKLYIPGEKYTFGNAWTDGASTGDTFIFHAIWLKEQPVTRFYENFSMSNYVTSSMDNIDVFKNNYISRDESIHKLSVDKVETLNNQNSLKIVSTTAGSTASKDFAISTTTNDGILEAGKSGDSRDFVMTFYAKSNIEGTKLNIRWGYSSDIETVNLTSQWVQYKISLPKTKYYGSYIHCYLDRAATVYMNNIVVAEQYSSSFLQEDGFEPTVMEYTPGEPITALPAVTRIGYNFLGWYTQKVGGEEIKLGTIAPKYDTNLYAHWEKEFSEIPVNEFETPFGKRYEYYDNALSWEDAKKHCESLGGHLVTIGSQEENDIVFSMIEGTGHFAWIGASYNSETLNWEWVTGEEFVYTNWIEGEPSNSEEKPEIYAQIMPFDIGLKDSTGKWNDANGGDGFFTHYGLQNSSYICEYEIEKPTEPSEVPTQPTEPTEPSEGPTQPTEPTEPSEGPTQPTEPTEPSEVPTQPTEPTEPSEVPTQPTEPTEPTEVKMELDAYYSDNVINGEKLVYTFTPTVSDYYRFYTLGYSDTYVDVYDAYSEEIINNDDNSGVSSNCNLTTYLEKGVTYYYYVQTFGDEAYFYSCITRVSTTPSTSISKNQTYEVELYENNISKFFEFVPKESGFYAFASEDSSDAYCIFYDDQWKPLNKNDDGTDNDFYLECYLEAGNTYYFEASCLDVWSGDSYTVSIKEVNVITEVEIVEYPEDLTCYEGYIDDTLDLSGLKLKLTYSDGSVKYWEYGDEYIVGSNLDFYWYYDADDVLVYQVCTTFANDFFFPNAMPNPVKSINIVDPPLVQYYKGTNGYYDEYGDRFYYDIPDMSGMEIEVEYVDGTSEIVSFYDGINGRYFKLYDDQYYSPWEVGYINAVTIEYYGVCTFLDVEIIENPVESITLNNAPTATYMYGDEDYGFIDEDGVYGFIPFNLEDLSLTINYKDGTSKVVGYDDIDIDTYSIDGQPINMDFILADGVGEYEATLYLMGQEITYSVSVVDSIKGDVDGDGKVSVMDATAIQLHMAEISLIDDAKLSCADVDGDGKVSVMDATKIQLFIAEIVEEL